MAGFSSSLLPPGGFSRLRGHLPAVTENWGTRSVSVVRPLLQGFLQGAPGALEVAGTAPSLFSTDLGALKLMPGSQRVRSWHKGGS